ncbi:MAG: HEPN domain-containing protein [Anaerostipes hadrus]|nr:HEPN domain-containing protein [Anaerostipes hadrus]
MERHNKDVGTKEDLMLYRIRTAKENLRSARILLDAQEYKDAIANFNKNYIKTEVFPREIGRKISEAEEIRHASDYDDFYIASKEEAERQVSVADEFIQLIEAYCNKRIKK